MTDQELIQFWNEVNPMFLMGDWTEVARETSMHLTALQSENAEIKEKNAGLALALLFDCKPNDDCLGDDEWGAIKAALSRVEAERDATQKEIERMKDIMRQHGIMVIPGKHPGSRPEWNISRGAQGEG